MNNQLQKIILAFCIITLTCYTFSYAQLCNCSAYRYGCPAGKLGTECIYRCNNYCASQGNPPDSCTFSASISPKSAYSCNGTSVILNAYPSGSAYSYQWMLNGSEIPGA